MGVGADQKEDQNHQIDGVEEKEVWMVQQRRQLADTAITGIIGEVYRLYFSKRNLQQRQQVSVLQDQDRAERRKNAAHLAQGRRDLRTDIVQHRQNIHTYIEKLR